MTEMLRRVLMTEMLRRVSMTEMLRRVLGARRVPNILHRVSITCRRLLERPAPQHQPPRAEPVDETLLIIFNAELLNPIHQTPPIRFI